MHESYKTYLRWIITSAALALFAPLWAFLLWMVVDVAVLAIADHYHIGQEKPTSKQYFLTIGIAFVCLLIASTWIK